MVFFSKTDSNDTPSGSSEARAFNPPDEAIEGIERQERRRNRATAAHEVRVDSEAVCTFMNFHHGSQQLPEAVQKDGDTAACNVTEPPRRYIRSVERLSISEISLALERCIPSPRPDNYHI
jgi:hypothetical protein